MKIYIKVNRRYSFGENIQIEWHFVMNLSIFDELQLFSKEFQRYILLGTLEQLAKNIVFVQ